MLDEFVIAALGFIAGGAVSYYYRWLTRDVGTEPTYDNTRKNREPHVHHYDTMDPSTNGKYVCGTCRKVNPRG